MTVIVGLFETQPQAEAALIRLRDAGFRDDQVALIANAQAPAAAEETAAPAETRRPTSETDEAITNAALGAAIGVILGGGLFRPLGIVIGGLAGTGIVAALTARGVPAQEAQEYEAQLSAGRYLVAVESESAEHGPAEVRALLQEEGVDRVIVEP